MPERKSIEEAMKARRALEQAHRALGSPPTRSQTTRRAPSSRTRRAASHSAPSRQAKTSARRRREAR